MITSWTLGAALLAVLVLPFAWRTATSDEFLVVTGTSMQPTYQLGDVLIIAKPDGQDLEHVGAIVVATFGQARTSRDQTGWYVHRVHEVTADGALLKGDANPTPDPRPITPDQVVGTPRAHLTGAPARAFAWTQDLAGRAILATTTVLLLWALPGRLARTPAPPGPGDPTTDTRRTRRTQIATPAR